MRKSRRCAVRFSLAEVIETVAAVLCTAAAVAFLCLGCCSIGVDRKADGAWSASYYSYGLWTSIGRLEVDVSTNGVARLRMDNLGSDVSTNHAAIVDSSAGVAGVVVEGVVRGISK